MKLQWLVVFLVLITGCFSKTDDIPKEDPELDNEINELSDFEENNQLIFDAFEDELEKKSIVFEKKRAVFSPSEGFVDGIAYEFEDGLSGFEIHIYKNNASILEEIRETGEMTVFGSTMTIPANVKDNRVLIFIGDILNREVVLDSFNKIN